MAKLRPGLLFAAAGCGAIILIALLGPALFAGPANHVELDQRLLPPSALHWFGTDDVGRDLFVRIVFGARVSLLAALSTIAIGLTGGMLIGGFAGLVGGWVESALMRMIDAILSVPSLIVALALAAALGPNLRNAVLAIGLLSIPVYARVARAEALAIVGRDYVKAARLMGASNLHQIRANLLPNMLPPLLVYATGNVGAALLATASLSFIGLGAQPPTSEWGAMISASRSFLFSHWWYSFFPGAAITVTVSLFTLLGDALRDLLDPRERPR
ncbi:ABC transporter permease [Roseiterribacter gracilis]|uniref:Cytochrome c550 n=1 Tax=Roseiterribacter gracilis TaxID=2812848 RepID=A0A8S8XC48_9PROT|nr:cytochrome c550 [Rhodospirillales bacterium TMPK1]